MSDPVFVPANDLERTLAHAKAGAREVPEFLDQMLRSQVVLLADKEIGPEGWDNSANLLILTTPDKGPGLCVFTSVERAQVWLQRFPDFEYALTVDCPWVLQGVQSGTAVLINPGWGEGLVIPPHAVEELKRAANPA
jgi:hypothetical protein